MNNQHFLQWIIILVNCHWCSFLRVANKKFEDASQRLEEKHILDNILDENIYDARIRPAMMDSVDGPTNIQAGLEFRFWVEWFKDLYRGGGGGIHIYFCVNNNPIMSSWNFIFLCGQTEADSCLSAVNNWYDFPFSRILWKTFPFRKIRAQLWTRLIWWFAALTRLMM